MTEPYYNLVDNIIVGLDNCIKTLSRQVAASDRSDPSAKLSTLSEQQLTDAEKKRSMRLMRVNHSGEVAAQALYQGQALTAVLPEVKVAMEQAALEENDHLIWCEQRVKNFDGHTSIFNPLWYIGSFTIGAIAGKVGDKWSLGFVAETEKQVVKHIEKHLSEISPHDLKSHAILEQLKIDELHHYTVAQEAGAVTFPKSIKMTMKFVAQIMTKSSYWL